MNWKSLLCLFSKSSKQHHIVRSLCFQWIDFLHKSHRTIVKRSSMGFLYGPRKAIGITTDGCDQILATKRFLLKTWTLYNATLFRVLKERHSFRRWDSFLSRIYSLSLHSLRNNITSLSDILLPGESRLTPSLASSEGRKRRCRWGEINLYTLGPETKSVRRLSTTYIIPVNVLSTVRDEMWLDQITQWTHREHSWRRAVSCNASRADQTPQP